MDLSSSKRERYTKLIMYCCIALMFAVAIIQYTQYIMVAKSTVPIMDFWRWTRVYGEKVHEGTIRFSDYFFSDAGEHMQPFAMALQFSVLNAHDFDVQALVTWGIPVRAIIAALLVAVFLWRYREHSGYQLIPLGMCAVAIIMAVFNYNQWEIATEPFSFASACRVLLYFLSFLWADQFARGFSNRTQKANFIHGGLLGGYCAFLTVFVGSAYFVGHLPAIGLVLAVVLWRHRDEWKRYIGPLALWFGISFAGALIYYILFSMGGRSVGITVGGLETIITLISGVVIFWGSIILPEALQGKVGVASVCVIGVLMLVYVAFLLLRYIRSKDIEKHSMPAICLLYALAISVMICWGRIGRFGPETMVASRYVVESSIGLVGMIWMTYALFGDAAKNWLMACKVVAAPLLCILMMLCVIKVETGIAPYRKIYYENLADMMRNIDDYADEELGAFQANSPDDVRYCIEFFKENNLSIFRKE